jgi:hypothetical protein
VVKKNKVDPALLARLKREMAKPRVTKSAQKKLAKANAAHRKTRVN